MRIALFGTGVYYERYKVYFREKNVVCLVSNGATDGEIVDGHDVLRPDQIEVKSIDRVYVLVKNYDEIVEQLLKLGFTSASIRTYLDIVNDFDIELRIHGEGGIYSLPVVRKDDCKKRVLILSHGYSLTGVPIALMNLSILFQEIGWCPIYAGIHGGGLRDELSRHRIYYTDELNIYLETESFWDLVEISDLVIVGTLSILEIGHRIQKTEKPIIWWSHETLDQYYMGKQVYKRAGKDLFLGVGQRVMDVFHSYFPDVKMTPYNYYLPELEDEIRQVSTQEFVVAEVGTIEIRKGQDVLLSAISKIDISGDAGIKALFVGAMSATADERLYRETFLDKIEKTPSAKYLGELSRDEINDFYSNINLLVCPSRDDPMPIVVTEAMQRGIPCVVSSVVGQAMYIKNGLNGYVFESESVDELKELLIINIRDRMLAEKIGTKGKEIYEKYFTKSTAKQGLLDVLKTLDMP